MLCLVTKSCPTLPGSMDCSAPSSSVHGISRQEYWSGCHFLLQRIFLSQGLNLHLLCLLHWQADSLPLAPPGKPKPVLLLLFNHSVVSDPLQPHRLQHTRPPYPSPSPRVCKSSCSLHQWCHPSHPLMTSSLSALDLSQHWGLFKWVICSHQMTKILELPLQH